MRLFISYDHDDYALVQTIVEILRHGGHDPWFDHRLLPGDDWQAELLRSIVACDAFVYMLSLESLASEWCQWEFLEAVKLAKPVVSAMIRRCDPQPPLDSIQYADFTQGPTPVAIAQLMGGLHRRSEIAPSYAPKLVRQPRGIPAQVVSPPIARLSYEPETVIIPAGPFIMGSSGEQIMAIQDVDARKWAEKTEQPQRLITLPKYRMGKYPVTVGEYRTFVDFGGYAQQRYWTDLGWQWHREVNISQPKYWTDEKWVGDDHLPVIGVSWYEAIAYVRWLSEATEQIFHLPNEAEWEKAARSTDGWIYSWGDEWRAGMCNTADAEIGHTTSVGQFSPQGDSLYGLADVLGNVWEWCSTPWRERYEHGSGEKLNRDDLRVLRGGTFDSNRDVARAACRNRNLPYSRFNNIGFRVACGSSTS